MPRAMSIAGRTSSANSGRDALPGASGGGTRLRARLTRCPPVRVARTRPPGGTATTAARRGGVGQRHVVGRTDSTDFPMGPIPFQSTNGVGFDAFVARLVPRARPSSLYLPRAAVRSGLSLAEIPPTSSTSPVVPFDHFRPPPRLATVLRRRRHCNSGYGSCVANESGCFRAARSSTHLSGSSGMRRRGTPLTAPQGTLPGGPIRLTSHRECVPDRLRHGCGPARDSFVPR